jgi:hypothetical protein
VSSFDLAFRLDVMITVSRDLSSRRTLSIIEER